MSSQIIRFASFDHIWIKVDEMFFLLWGKVKEWFVFHPFWWGKKLKTRPNFFLVQWEQDQGTHRLLLLIRYTVVYKVSVLNKVWTQLLHKHDIGVMNQRTSALCKSLVTPVKEHFGTYTQGKIIVQMPSLSFARILRVGLKSGSRRITGWSLKGNFGNSA